MSRSGAITLEWADGEHRFRLPIGLIRELQEKTGHGPQSVYSRLAVTGEWQIDDVRETIRLGLIGGGIKPVEALSLVRRYVDEWPLLENVPIAAAIIGAALFSPPEDMPGEPIGAEAETAPA